MLEIKKKVKIMDRRKMKKLVLMSALQELERNPDLQRELLADWVFEEKLAKNPKGSWEDRELATPAGLRRMRKLLREMVENAESKLD
jgi:hypothetical protein